MSDFDKVYKSLNVQQKQAVDNIDGPLLVVAGPGTGKTQLLSARAAHILEATDSLPSNILCLTFTDNGALNMRNRLTSFIGKDAYDVNISTYHAFGGDLIKRYPEYFLDSKLDQPLDELGRHQLVTAITDKLSYHDPLKKIKVKDLISTISEVKRALLSSQDLRAIAKENDDYLKKVNAQLIVILADFKSMTGKFDKINGYFQEILEALQENSSDQPINQRFGSLATIATHELATALEAAAEIGKTKPLTAWKNKWLAKNGQNQFILTGQLEIRRLHSLAQILDDYEKSLQKSGFYDFDDMILRSITALSQNDDLRFSLQEKYLYIMLDEYQDTNAAQAKIVQLLTNNPASEGRPNVMAVGDDDQAIYAFQGAQYSNMLDFKINYRDTTVVNLQQNYRSSPEILQFASNISSQIEERLLDSFDGLSKGLSAANKSIPSAKINRQEYLSDVAQYHDAAQQITDLIKHGTQPSEIVALSPSHKQLEALAVHLTAAGVPVHYEKRENILESAVIRQIVSMARLVQALNLADNALADSLWPEVLSYDFWHLPVDSIWQIGWSIHRSKSPSSWAEALVGSDLPKLRQIGLYFLSLAGRASYEPLETMLDYLTGSLSLEVDHGSAPEFTSPLRDHYADLSPQSLYQMVSNLTVLRSKLRDYQVGRDMLTLSGLLELIEAYAAADQSMQDTSPYNEASQAVQLMTVFKAKGLEFEHVFLLSVIDEIWGSSKSSGKNNLKLPVNLAPIRHSGANQDELLRLLFVALTRAKFGLYLLNYVKNYAGKDTTRLKYLNEYAGDDNIIRAHSLPKAFSAVISHDKQAPGIAVLETNWRDKHRQKGDVKLNALLESRLKSYQISPTHVNNFCDLIYGGPESFFFSTILRFPASPGFNAEFGNAIHASLQWLQNNLNQNASLPNLDKTLAYFATNMRSRKMPPEQTELLVERGELALTSYLKQRSSTFEAGNIAEKDFKNEAVFIDEAHLSGKIDLIEINKLTKTITVVDYKTGQTHDKWKSDARLHKYRQQLYFYKLLIEGSSQFKGYDVTAGRLEFIEPNDDGQIISLTTDFNDDDLKRMTNLTKSVWSHIQKLDFPDIDNYATSLTGIRTLEEDLIKGQI